jgi:hypothetical protein
MTPATIAERRSEQTTGRTAIRPFRVDVPEADLMELRRRITATRLPEKETVGDFTQGVPLATVQKLANAGLHHRDRWSRHPLHSRALEA